LAPSCELQLFFPSYFLGHNLESIPSYLDSAAFVKAKINNAGILALGRHSSRLCLMQSFMVVLCLLGYTQALRPGVKASFGLAIDTQRLNDAGVAGPAHKVGSQFVFEA
jgi:voltage-dependent anion channel protein 2